MAVAAWIGRTISLSSQSAGAGIMVGGMKQAVEQADAADEGRLEEGRGIMAGGSAVGLSSWVRARSCALRS
jgi:hypothetical protein